MNKERNISIIWDFDGTLTLKDSTTETIDRLSEGQSKKFWNDIKKLRGGGRPKWEHILASDAPIWMFSLSRLANRKRVPLNKEFFKTFVVPYIKLHLGVRECLKGIKNLEERQRFKQSNIKIYHFILSAGLKDLIEEVMSKDPIRWIFGCRYEIEKVVDEDNIRNGEIINVPVFCMDETMKTRSIFEIAKGTFQSKKRRVNKRILSSKLWCAYSDMIYVGDGPTDIPALSLVRDRGGTGVVVYDNKDVRKTRSRLKELSLDRRANIITPADFSKRGELFQFIKARCYQILQEYEASDFLHKSLKNKVKERTVS